MCGKIENIIQDRKITLRVSGKLRGHAALNCFSALRETVLQEKLPVIFDLRECTSIDSIGVAILKWIRTTNGNSNVKILKPKMNLNEKDLASAELSYISTETLPGPAARLTILS